MSTIRVEGAELYYRIDDFTDPWGPAETVFLAHSAAGNVERWRAWVPALARHYRVVRMDMRGHGRSTTPGEHYQWSIERLAQDVRDLLVELDTGPVHYVGNSAGGIVGLQFVLDYPELVRSLTLVGATPHLAQTRVDLTEWLDRIERLGIRGFFHSDAAVRLGPDADPALVAWLADEAAKTPKSVFTTLVPYLGTVDHTERLSEIRVPVLILAAEYDDITPPEVQHLLRDALPDARLKLYPTWGHNIADYYPDHCAADTLAFLREVSAGR